MSSTIVSTRTTRTTAPASIPSNAALSGVLSDYELHHSGSVTEDSPDSIDSPDASTTGRSGQTHSATPDDWDTTHRRVPPYRPINTARDRAETRVYINRIEQMFIGTMFTGVFLNSMASKVWHQTLGRVNGDIFRYKVGGEF